MARGGFNTGNPDLVKWATGIIENLEDVSREELEITAKEGEEFARGYIMTRGTNKTWKRAHNGKTGGGRSRYETGHMVDSISSNVTSQGPRRARAFFGWLGGWQSGENKYFQWQEGGFTHNFTGEHIEGMYAITDAGEAAFANLRGRLAAAIKKAAPPSWARIVDLGKGG